MASKWGELALDRAFNFITPNRRLTRRLMQLHMGARKDILLYTRVRNHPDRNSFLSRQLVHRGKHKRVRKAKPSIDLGQHMEWTINMDDFYDDFDELPERDLSNSFLSMVVRNLPVMSNDYADQENGLRRESFYKEFEASQSMAREQKYDYTCIFSTAPGSAYTPFHLKLPPRHDLSMEIRGCLLAWKKRVSRMLIYPKTSKKTMGTTSSYTLCEAEGWTRSEWRRRSTMDYERFYHYTGRILEGPAQMRQTFAHNDLRPRTYFALGLTNYNKSKNLQPIFNELLDVFPNTHRFSRYRLKRLRMTPNDYAIVYDFSQFTSRMSESRYFTRDLANYATGTVIAILDTYEGIIERDLGEMLHEYNEANNHDPQFEIDEALRDLTEQADLLYCHRCCGMLGVHGNLAGCTVLHGIILAFVTGSMERCSCVGDDALAICEVRVNADPEEGEEVLLETIFDSFAIISDAGKLALAKTRQFLPRTLVDMDEDLDDWAYLKRSLYRDDDGFHQLRSYPYPHWSWVFHKEIRTTRSLKFKMEDKEIIPRVVTQCFQLMAKVYDAHMAGEDFLINDLKVLWSYLTSIYNNLNLPRGGHIRGRAAEGRWLHRYAVAESCCLFVPCLPATEDQAEWFVEMDPLERLVRGDGDPYIVPLPVVSDREIREFEGSRHAVGEKFLQNGGRLTNLLEDLGYLSKKAIIEDVHSDDLLLKMRSFMKRETSIVYRFEILKELPSWVDDVLTYENGYMYR